MAKANIRRKKTTQKKTTKAQRRTVQRVDTGARAPEKLSPEVIENSLTYGRLKLKKALDGATVPPGFDPNHKAAFEKAQGGVAEPDYGHLFAGYDLHGDLKTYKHFQVWALAALCWIKKKTDGSITCHNGSVTVNLPQTTNVSTPQRKTKTGDCTKVDPILANIKDRLKRCKIFAAEGGVTTEMLLTDLHKELKL